MQLCPVSFVLPLLAVFLFFSAFVENTFGYFATNQKWLDGSDIQMELQLGPTNVVLQDGFKTWNDSAADALKAWSPDLATAEFSWVFDSNATQASGDGNNCVFFSDSVFGDDFGGDVLAVTVYLLGDGISEADVIVNQAYDFNSYRGSLQKDVSDIHRVFLHEFGHVLGLAHPDEYGQDVDAIMNSSISDLDQLTQDDHDGAWSIYGVKRDVQTDLFTFVGAPFSYQVTTNVPATSYAASGLPNGMTIDPKSGLITGVADLNAVYTAQITFDGHPLDIYENSLTIYVYPASPGDFRANFPGAVNRLLADPTRPRVYASMPYGPSIVAIDTTSLSIIATIPVESEPRGIALSPDGKKLFIAETGYNPVNGNVTDPVVGVLDAESLSPLASLLAPTGLNDVAAGLDDRLFVATYTSYAPGNLFEMNAVTGQALFTFPVVDFSGDLALNPDRTILHSDGTYFFDVSTITPTILQQSSAYPFSRLSHNGKALCSSSNQQGAAVTILQADDLSQTGVTLIPAAGVAPTAMAAFSWDDTTLFTFTHSATTTDYVDLYDAVTGNHLRSLAGRCETVVDMVVDGSGQYIFTASSDYLGSLLVYGTGLGTPFHPAKPQRLLNVSTRLATAPGEDVLIGGLIITGHDPKQLAIRGLGPSLPVTGRLVDPVIELYDEAGKVVESNDNWNLNRASVLRTGLAPLNELEAASVVTVTPGNYTVIVHGAKDGSGQALVEIYDLTPDSDSTLANLSTRGNVQTGDNVMIGGFIISNDVPTKVMLRAIGPSLTKNGISGALQDPLLELHGGDGDLIFSNDSWRSTQQADIIATGIPPSDDRESAIIATLQPGNYTAIVRGQADSTGVALVEIYNLDYASSASK